MSEEIFTASNQLSVAWRENEAGNKTLHASWGSLTPLWVEVIGFSESSATNKALEEFYLHRNGLWKDPETGALVIRLPEEDDGDGRRALQVVPEGESYPVVGVFEGLLPHSIQPVKERYFTALPREEPKPWLDAEPGEAWLLTVNGKEGVYVRDSQREFNGSNEEGHFTSYFDTYTKITAGKRIWPTEGEDE